MSPASGTGVIRNLLESKIKRCLATLTVFPAAAKVVCAHRYDVRGISGRTDHSAFRRADPKINCRIVRSIEVKTAVRHLCSRPEPPQPVLPRWKTKRENIVLFSDDRI